MTSADLSGQGNVGEKGGAAKPDNLMQAAWSATSGKAAGKGGRERWPPDHRSGAAARRIAKSEMAVSARPDLPDKGGGQTGQAGSCRRSKPGYRLRRPQAWAQEGGRARPAAAAPCARQGSCGNVKAVICRLLRRATPPGASRPLCVRRTGPEHSPRRAGCRARVPSGPCQSATPVGRTETPSPTRSPG